MPTRRVGIGPTGEAVRANIKKIRRRYGLSLRELSDKLAENGYAMAHNTISEIENGARRVDVDDLVQIATALEVLPIDLLGISNTMDVIPSFVLDQLQQIIKDFGPTSTGGGDAGPK